MDDGLREDDTCAMDDGLRGEDTCVMDDDLREREDTCVFCQHYM